MKKKEENENIEAQEEFVTEPAENPLADKVSELTNDLQRTRADFENFRKQTEIQKKQAMEITKLTTVSKVLPLLDDIDRAISTYPEQLAPIQKSLEKTLKELNLKKIDSETEIEFNPDLHDAVMVEESDGEKEVISETLRPGYYFGEEVVRPAMVKVKRV